MTYPWAIVIVGLGLAIAIGQFASIKFVPDPISAETACIQQRGHWVAVWHGQHWFSNGHFTCEFTESRKD